MSDACDPSVDWRPTASLENLKRRAQLLAQVRAFFAERGVMEVETPLLGAAPVTDPHIDAVSAEHPAGAGRLFLQTSPEYAMKRLLAAGSGPIYQLGRVFRKGERGRRHNPEFTMLEWYRPGWSLGDLMSEVAELVNQLLPGDTRPPRHWRYRELFRQRLQLDPARASAAECEALARERLDVQMDSADRDSWLQLLFSALLEPELGRGELTFVQDFPASQCALAALATDSDGIEVAQRFELFIDGVELANGYYELTDPAAQRARFERDNALRRQRGQAPMPIDERLLQALRSGMPPGAGVALGVDRLLMRVLGVDSIDQVIAFPVEKA